MTNSEIFIMSLVKANLMGTDFEAEAWIRVYPVAAIFTSKFAKAFWGSDYHRDKNGKRTMVGYCTKCEEGELDTEYCWQYHLQQMVLEENPLKYLEKFL